MSLNEYVAGAVGGVTGIFIGHPLDTLKVQAQLREKQQKVSAAIRSVNKEGLTKGFFRGMAFPISTYAVVNSAYFGVYGNCLKLMQPDKDTKATNMQVYLAGCVGGSVQLLFSCPTDVVKCTMQSQIPGEGNKAGSSASSLKYFKGPMQCFSHILKTQGIRGAYKGGATMFVRDVPSFGLYITVFERLNEYMITHKLTDSGGVIANLMAGGVAGCTCWASIIPFDVIKSRLQTDHGGRYKGFFDCGRQSVKESGISVLYRGMTVTMLRAFPVNAVTFLGYSKTLEWLDQTNPPSSSKQSKKDEFSID